jgi:hypothetical protein
MVLKWNGGGFGRPQPQQEAKMANYLILKSCMAGGAARSAGEIVELSEQEGKSLLAMGRVDVAPESAAPAVADRSVALDTSDAPKVSKRAKKE